MTTQIRLFSLLSALSLAFLTGASAPAKGTLVIEIVGFRSGTGEAVVSLYAAENAEAFPRKPEKAKEARFLPISKDKAIRWEVSGLSFGSYAAILFHDENGDRELATNFVGIPKEGLGISNDFKPRFGPPDFDDARFDFTRTGQVVRINLQY